MGKCETATRHRPAVSAMVSGLARQASRCDLKKITGKVSSPAGRRLDFGPTRGTRADAFRESSDWRESAATGIRPRAISTSRDTAKRRSRFHVPGLPDRTRTGTLPWRRSRRGEPAARSIDRVPARMALDRRMTLWAAEELLRNRRAARPSSGPRRVGYRSSLPDGLTVSPRRELVKSRRPGPVARRAPAARF